MDKTTDFQDIFQRKISDELSELETQRQALVSYLKKLVSFAVGFFVVAFISVQLLIHNANDKSFILILLAVGFVGTVLFLWTIKYTKYEERFKEVVISEIFRFIDKSLQYFPSHYVTEDKFIESSIFDTRPDRYGGSDLVSGRIGYTEIEFSLVHAEYEEETISTDEDGHSQTDTYWVTIFEGIFIVADFNKHFSTHVLILPGRTSKPSANILKYLGFSLAWKILFLEDPEFDKYFTAFGEDQIEARYILSTSLVKRIVEFRKRVKGDIYISFKNSKIYVAIPTVFNFKPLAFESVINGKVLKRYYETLFMITSIVEDLNLNTRIWSKQPNYL